MSFRQRRLVTSARLSRYRHAGPQFGTGEEDGISALCGGEGLVGERGTVGIDGSPILSELGVCMQCMLRTCTTHEIVLEVELANAGLVFLKSPENLIDPVG
ncbi:hypothetical protein FMUND_3064 [Fusarium mundagurra]|uniref:Uncharacterized protein n=1 Tax=Fusarium mundagurra TaxID=1567541 RepID=A0A8H5Z3H5_9HYPO|nr:hypothetical protein FMUND_3064 [Fusarium mundagurra]